MGKWTDLLIEEEKKNMPKLQKTTNYSDFVNHEDNRAVTRVAPLIKSMRKYGFVPAHPIHCVLRNGKKYVLDGGHRLEAAKRVGCPVYYVVLPESPITISEINSVQRPWGLLDYLEYFCRQGKQDYLTLREFCEDEGLGIANSISLLHSGSAALTCTTKLFKAGEFQVRYLDFAKQVALSIKRLAMANPDFTDVLYLRALLACFRVEEFNIERFIKAVEKAGTELPYKRRIDDVLIEFERIYNSGYSKGRKIPLAFLAANASRDRYSSRKRAT